MITAVALQNAYNDLYVAMRNYIWDFDTVEALADLEIGVYQTFPDIDNVKKKLNALKRLVSFTYVYREDEKIQSAFDEIESQIEDTEIYANLKTFNKVVIV